MIRTSTTLLRLIVFTVLLTALGSAAAAQDAPAGMRVPAVMPAVDAGTADGYTQTTALRSDPVLTLLEPADMSELRTSTVFMWSHIGAAKYKFTLRDTTTGRTHQRTVKAAACTSNTCTLPTAASGLLDAVSDGATVKWHVKAVLPGGSVKSVTRTLTVNEVVTPTLTGPADGAGLQYLSSVSWSNANAVNDFFRVVMIDAKTGKKALNQFYDAVACGAECSLQPRKFTNKLTPGRPYKWYVLAVGLSGEKAKSETRTVIID